MDCWSELPGLTAKEWFFLDCTLLRVFSTQLYRMMSRSNVSPTNVFCRWPQTFASISLMALNMCRQHQVKSSSTISECARAGDPGSGIFSLCLHLRTPISDRIHCLQG